MARAMLIGSTMRRARRRGFTLVELMIVVAIVGILAALAIYGLKRYQQSASTGEATAMLMNVRGVEESWRAENLAYGGCSAANAGPALVATLGPSDLYPRSLGNMSSANTGSRKVGWGMGPGAVANVHSCVRALGLRSDGPVRFTYGILAGAPSAASTAFSLPSGAGIAFAGSGLPNFVPTEPWYLGVAYADRDEDGSFARLSTVSLKNEVYMEDDTE